jgi:hypothetical protein
VASPACHALHADWEARQLVYVLLTLFEGTLTCCAFKTKDLSALSAITQCVLSAFTVQAALVVLADAEGELSQSSLCETLTKAGMHADCTFPNESGSCRVQQAIAQRTSVGGLHGS